MTAPPPSDTEAYRWWRAGALAEARAREEGRSRAGLEVRSFVDGLAQHKQDLTRSEVAAWTYYVYALPAWSLGSRMRCAWHLLIHARPLPMRHPRTRRSRP